MIPIMQQLCGLDRHITTGGSDRPMYEKAFQPRLGASYSLFGDQRTVLFGGFGIYFDRNYWNTLFEERFRRQNRQLDINFKTACAPNEFACAVWDPRYFDPGGFGPYQQRTYLFQPPARAFLGMGRVFAYQNADLRVEKGMTVARGQQASLTLDLFNAFNSTNWGCYDTTIIPTANQATDVGWQRNFNQPRCAGLGRRLQLGLRYGYRGAGDATSGNTVR